LESLKSVKKDLERKLDGQMTTNKHIIYEKEILENLMKKIKMEAMYNWDRATVIEKDYLNSLSNIKIREQHDKESANNFKKKEMILM
jgi:nitrogenase subunit NifH